MAKSSHEKSSLHSPVQRGQLMATIDDLQIKSIADMTPDEAIEYLRQIRLSRRTPVKKTNKTSTATKISKKPIPKVSASDAAELLKLLGG